MGKLTRTRRTRIAADMARMLRELQQVPLQQSSAHRQRANAHHRRDAQLESLIMLLVSLSEPGGLTRDQGVEIVPALSSTELCKAKSSAYP